jgi:phenylalanyl-tRNA synthetase beta chain
MFQVAMAGFTEVLTWILSSLDENFNLVKRKDSGAVIVGNPRTSEFEV